MTADEARAFIKQRVEPGNYPTHAGEESILRVAVLQEAADLVGVTREQEYGDPVIHFTEVAKVWTVILGVHINAVQAQLMMAGLKLVRLKDNPTHRDSSVDLAGYGSLAHETAVRIKESAND